MSPFWTSSAEDFTGDVAWGDVDNDGDLDLAVGNFGSNYLYINDNGSIPREPSWKSADSRDTFDLAWADYDSDGDIDLAAGNRNSNDTIYQNVNGKLQATPSWVSNEDAFTTAVKWGDVDCDGDLDLVAAHYPGNITVYPNQNGNIGLTPSWRSADLHYAHTIVLGDVNNDGYIDLLVGNGKLLGGDRNYVYFNTGTGFPARPNWETQNPKRTTAIDLGDYDRDGDLDLAYATLNQGTYVHNNENDNFTIKASWTARDTSTSTYDIAWADVTGNGYLDLVLAVNGKNKIYKNTGGVLETYASWYTDEDVGTSSIGAGDHDGDSDLDIVFGSDLPAGEPDYLYMNNGSVYARDPSWTATISERPNGIWWYDLDDDGDLDLAVGTNGRNRVYYNKGTELFTTAGWSSADSRDTRTIAWGDFDSDGDFDLAAGNYGTGNVIYRNNYGSLTTSPWWNSGTTDNTAVLAAGDVDDDGDLDLAVGNYGGPDYIYLNTGSGLSTTYAWSSNDTSLTRDLAWGDIDNDGLLDLAVASGSAGVMVYHNQGRMISGKPSWTSSYVNDTRSVCWADINGDGFSDLITGTYSGPMYVYLNANGSLPKVPSWQQRGAGQKTVKNYLVDLNGDGRTDVFELNDGQPDRIFPNIHGALREFPTWSTNSSGTSTDASFGDMDKDGDVDIALADLGGRLEVYRNTNIIEPVLINNPTYIRILSPPGLISSSHYSYGLPYEGNVAVKYTLFDPEGAPAWVVPRYSSDGGGTWHTATPSVMSGDPTTGLTATPTGQTYTFLWDSRKDNVVSKNVMFRITVNSIHDVAGRIQKTGVSAYTGAFPVASAKLHPPLNLRVVGTSTDSISLEWNAVPDESIHGYEMFMNASYTDMDGPFRSVATFGNVTKGTVTDLADGVTYFFKLRSFDSYGIRSLFSNTAYGTTVPLNLPPMVLKDIPDVEMDEDTKLLNHLDLNDHFRDELSNSSNFGSDGLSFTITDGEHINCWISPGERLNIEPAPNWFGSEEFTVTVNDTVFSISRSFNVTVRSVNDRPILNVTDGARFYAVQGEWFNLTVTGYDPADPHDRLTFSDNSSLFDIGADTGNISFNPLPWDVGNHSVNITLSDSGEPTLRSSARVVFVINSTDIPPRSQSPVSTLVYPEDEFVVTTLNPNLMWDGYDPDSPVIWYDVYLSSDRQLVRELSFFARIGTRMTNISMTVENDLTNGEIYYWTVIPFDGHVRGFCKSDIWAFKVDVSRSEPVVKLLSPANQKKVNSDTVRLSWQLDYDGSDTVKYYIYLDTNQVPKTLVASEITDLSLDVKDLVDGETYYWTVRPRALDVVGICISGTWSFSVNLNFTQLYCVDVVTQNMINVKVNETKLHDVTIINCGNDVDIFLVSLTAGDLEGSASLSSEWLTLTDLGNGFLELEPAQAITISILFGIHTPKLIGVHTIGITVTSLGAQYSDFRVSRSDNITVNVLDESGNGLIPDPGDPGGGGSDDPGTNNTNRTRPDNNDPYYYRISTFSWFWIILAIIIAVIFLASYSSYLMRKTRKKFEVYRTAQEILESKNIDTASPLVAGFLAAGKGGDKEADDALADIDLSPAEAETIKEALVIGSGVYTKATHELSIEERPYSAAAKRLYGDEYTSYKAPTQPEAPKPTPRPSPVPEPAAGAYGAQHVVGPISPYAMARRDYAEQMTKPVEGAVPMAVPAAAEVIDADEIVNKLKLLDKRFADGKISREQYRALKSKYTEAKPALPVSDKADKAYSPDYMYLRSEKPYDAAAKRLKLQQALREGKISKRLYEELIGNYQ